MVQGQREEDDQREGEGDDQSHPPTPKVGDGCMAGVQRQGGGDEGTPRGSLQPVQLELCADNGIQGSGDSENAGTDRQGGEEQTGVPGEKSGNGPTDLETVATPSASTDSGKKAAPKRKRAADKSATITEAVHDVRDGGVQAEDQEPASKRRRTAEERMKENKEKMVERGKVNEKMAAWKEVAEMLDYMNKLEKAEIDRRHKANKADARARIMATETAEEREIVKRMYGIGGSQTSVQISPL